MPVSLPPISRRSFLVRSIGGASAVFLAPQLFAGQTDQQANRFALFSDTHIAGDRKLVARGTNMTDNLIQVIKEALAFGPRPASVLVSGDCAFLQGLAGDYKTLLQLIEPLRTGGMPIHFALGNHDNRERLLKIVDDGRSDSSPVVGKHVTVLETPLANWILLDSLDKTNSTPGLLGEVQLHWLEQVLDQQKEKPVLVMVHHNPDSRPKPSGLVETKELLDLLSAHKQVKALLFGHSHHWSISRHENLHLVNLPAVAYVFGKGEPNGWVDASLRADGMTLCLHCIDKQNPRDGQIVNLKWA